LRLTNFEIFNNKKKKIQNYMERNDIENFACENIENDDKKKKNSNYYEYSDINTYYKEKKVYNTYGVI
jgi:hypothetical protein